MAMIPSSIINKSGQWKLIFILSPSDFYQSRFYELVQSPVIICHPGDRDIRR